MPASVGKRYKGKPISTGIVTRLTFIETVTICGISNKAAPIKSIKIGVKTFIESLVTIILAAQPSPPSTKREQRCL